MRTVGVDIKSRKRGVKASRANLHAAMLKAGIKTQAALAERIADSENLDSAPKDTVNRAFRQESVSPNTIARIAGVLKVEAYTLYLSSKELDDGDSNDSNNQQSAASNGTDNVGQATHSNSLIYKLIFVLIAIAAIYAAYLFSSHEENNAKTDYQLPLSVTLVQYKDSGLPSLTTALSVGLGESFKLSESSILEISPAVSPWDLPAKLLVDYVLVVTTEEKGRFVSVSIELVSKNQKELIFSDVWPANVLAQQQHKIVEKTVNKLNSIVGLLPAGVHAYEPPSIEAVTALLNGKDIADRALDKYRVSQSLVFYERATHFSPNYVKAQAAECNALSNSYYLSKDTTVLQQAFEECADFETAGQDVAEYQFAMGQLYRRKGDYENAELRYRNALKLEEGYLSAHLGLANTYLAIGTQRRDLEFFKKADEALERALSFSTEFWKIYHTQARISYMRGNPSKALELGEKAVSLSANLTSMNNLASYHYCSGEMLRAKEIYQQLSEMRYAPALIKYQLASVYSWYKEFPEAIALMESYISDVEEDGEVVALESLTGVADVYNESGNPTRAKELYQAAFERLEKERLNGEDNPMSQASSLYIEIALATLHKKKTNSQVRAEFVDRLKALESNAVNPNMKIRLLFSWMLLEEWQSAEVLYFQVAPMCKALAENSNFDRFRLKN